MTEAETIDVAAMLAEREADRAATFDALQEGSGAV